jgi:hypothetical protein
LKINWNHIELDENNIFTDLDPKKNKIAFQYINVKNPGLYMVSFSGGLLGRSSVVLKNRFHVGLTAEGLPSRYDTRELEISNASSQWFNLNSVFYINDPIKQRIFVEVESRQKNYYLSQGSLQILRLR